MSIMGSIYTNPSELGSDYWKERAETYLHDQELYQKECDTIRKQLDVANKQLRYTEELLDDWFDESGEYLSPTAIRDQITYIKSEIEKIGGKNE